MEFSKVFILGMLIGTSIEILLNFGYEIIFKKKLRIHHRFGLMGRLSLFSIPIWGMLALILANENKHLSLFLYAGFLGPLLELSAGKAFHRIFGVKLWTYKYGAIAKYTSIYAVPYWGGAALLFVLLARLAGL